jgi:hypothetical protein
VHNSGTYLNADKLNLLQRADEEAARLYEEFVESFKADDVPGGKHLCGGELSILMIVPNLVLKVYHQVSFLQSLPTSWTRHFPITVENPNEGPDYV